MLRRAHFAVHEYDAAAECCRKALEFEPADVNFVRHLMLALVHGGLPTEAIVFAEQWLNEHGPNAEVEEAMRNASTT